MNEESGFTGLSFPFRIGNKGGAVVSSVTPQSTAHVDESIEQILCTDQYERAMSPEFYSNLSVYVFEPNDISVQAILRYQIYKSLSEFETKIEVTEEDIELQCIDNKVIATINYVLRKFNTSHSVAVQLGGV